MGKQTDPTGLLYLRARYYNPTLGVFTGLDPVGGAAGLSASYNGYGYVHGNPANYVDLSGMCPENVWREKGTLACATYDVLTAANSVIAEVSPRAAAIADWTFEHTGAYDLFDQANYAVDAILAALGGDTSPRHGSWKEKAKAILTDPYANNAAYQQVRRDLEPSGWVVSLATMLFGSYYSARGMIQGLGVGKTIAGGGQAAQLALAGSSAVAINASMVVGTVAAVVGTNALLGSNIHHSLTGSPNYPCNGIYPCVGTQTGSTSKNAAKLADNLERAGRPRPQDGQKYAAHHIVPSTDPRAAQARRILYNAGIDINDALNGVWLPEGSNRFPHNWTMTQAYIKSVTSSLERASTPQDVVDILRFLQGMGR